MDRGCELRKADDEAKFHLWHYPALQTGASDSFSSSFILKMGMTQLTSEASRTLKGSLASRVFQLWVPEVIHSSVHGFCPEGKEEPGT